MTAAMEELLRSTRLPQFARQIEERLANEESRRQRFYDELSDDQKAEFINGEVIMHSPATCRYIEVLGNIGTLLNTLVNARKLGRVHGEKAMVHLTRNSYEPDLCYFGLEKSASLRPEQVTFPAPDFIIEALSPSTEATDRGIKFEDYAAHGVSEYWIVDPERETVEQYRLVGDAYQLNEKLAHSTIRSLVVRDFEVNVQAFFDAEENIRSLRTLLQS